MTINNKEIKVAGFVACHYGKEYAYACIKALDAVCDKIVVIYSDAGSQGHRTHIQCPDSEQELRAEMERASNKIEWIKGYFTRETDHRNEVLKYTHGYDCIVIADTDEVISPEDLPKAIEFVMNSKARHINVKGFINFWRSFNHVCYDGFLPYRFINLHNTDGIDTVECRFFHFGCAQNESVVRYKWHVSGHANELKAGWIDNTYLAWHPGCGMADLHCVSVNLWQTVEYDKTQLPEFLKSHENYNKDLI